MNKQLFITIEGCDGAGKSTLIKGLKKKFIELDYDFIVTKEPTILEMCGCEEPNCIERFHKMSFTPETELLLFLAARLHHIENVIGPSLAKDKIVICDRFNDSTIAYQGAGMELGDDYVEDLIRRILGTFEPDLTIYLDIDPIKGLKRKKKDGDLDLIESKDIEFHTRVRECYLDFIWLEPNRFFKVDGSKSKEKVLDEAFRIIQSKIT
jgi:dTMP kinase